MSNNVAELQAQVLLLKRALIESSKKSQIVVTHLQDTLALFTFLNSLTQVDLDSVLSRISPSDSPWKVPLVSPKELLRRQHDHVLNLQNIYLDNIGSLSPELEDATLYYRQVLDLNELLVTEKLSIGQTALLEQRKKEALVLLNVALLSYEKLSNPDSGLTAESVQFSNYFIRNLMSTFKSTVIEVVDAEETSVVETQTSPVKQTFDIPVDKYQRQSIDAIRIHALSVKLQQLYAESNQ